MNIRINLIKFRRTREKGKNTINYFAKQLDVTRQHYSNIENGLVNPSYGLMEKFSKVFDGEYEDIWELFKKEE